MENNKLKKTSSREYHLFAFKLLGDFGASIAIPVVVFVIIGQKLDGIYHKTPLFTILGFVTAALVSAKIIYKKSKAYGEEYKKLNDAGMIKKKKIFKLIMELHIPTLAPETIFHIGKFPITNTMVNAWLAIVIFLILGIFLKNKIRLKPGKTQNFIEYFLEKIFVYFDQVTGDRKKTLQFLPVTGSIFFFILLSNWLGLLPGTGSITLGESFLLRPANTDLNLTVAMALFSVISSHLFGLFSVGVFTHLNKFIQIGTLIKSLKKGPVAIFTAVIELVVGFIEIISEMAKVLSLSLRLFGNIFAGEVLISVISGIAGAIVPAPFMLLELLVGLIQASVFTMLTLVYLTVLTTKPHNEH